MKALSLIQPWATLLAKGIKKFETRSWSTQYRGPFLIHASKTSKGIRLFRSKEFLPYTMDILDQDLPLGAIVGGGIITNVIPTEEWLAADRPEADHIREKILGDMGPDRYAWEITGAFCLENPIPYKGALSLFEADVPDTEKLFKNNFQTI